MQIFSSASVCVCAEKGEQGMFQIFQYGIFVDMFMSFTSPNPHSFWKKNVASEAPYHAHHQTSLSSRYSTQESFVHWVCCGSQVRDKNVQKNAGSVQFARCIDDNRLINNR